MPSATPTREPPLEKATPPRTSTPLNSNATEKPGALTKIKKASNTKVSASAASSSRSSPAADSTTKDTENSKDKEKDTIANEKNAQKDSQQSTTATPSSTKKKNYKKAKAKEAENESAGKKVCTHCHNYVDQVGFKEHSTSCLKAKQAKAKAKEAAETSATDSASANGANGTTNGAKENDEEDVGKDKDANDGATATVAISATTKNSKKSTNATILEGGSAKKTNSKKRKATEDAGANTPDGKGEGSSKPPTKKQKKKEEAAAKAKAPKPKGPVDVEKQCGVLLPNGAMCARSLTCKSHAMGAKRAVPGRSAPYDVLLAQYQKKNQAKLQKAAMAATQPLPDDIIDNQAGPIDSDEERDAVMTAISRSNAYPVYERPVLSVNQRHQYIRMKDALHNALRGASGAGLFAVKSRDPISSTHPTHSHNASTSFTPNANGSHSNATPQPPTPTAANKAPGTPTNAAANGNIASSASSSAEKPVPNDGTGSVRGSEGPDGSLPMAWEYEIGGGVAHGRRMSGIQQQQSQAIVQQARSGSLGGHQSITI